MGSSSEIHRLEVEGRMEAERRRMNRLNIGLICHLVAFLPLHPSFPTSLPPFSDSPQVFLTVHSCLAPSYFALFVLHLFLFPSSPPHSLSLLLFLPLSAVDFSLAVAVIRSEMDGPALQSSPSLLLLMDLPARTSESFFRAARR